MSALLRFAQPAPNVSRVRVRIANSDREFHVQRGASLLDAALAASWKLPHGCRGGNCGLCKARLLQGSVDYPNGRPLGLGDAEASSHHILLCQARALSDLQIEVSELRTAQAHGAARLPCRIERAILAAPDVMLVTLRPPPAVEFGFLAGQHLDIVLPSGRRRSFSIASAPHAARLLELHVRKIPGGEWSGWLFGDGGRDNTAPLQGALLTIEGPLGHFYYRDEAGDAGPLLLVGGGTGIAPLLSMLRHLLARGERREIMLYWGVRGLEDLYAQHELSRLAAGAARMRYVPVLSQPPLQWTGRVGLVHAAVLDDRVELAACDIYAAGPPAMIDALRGSYLSRGAALERLYCDPFDYAGGPWDRQCKSADSSS